MSYSEPGCGSLVGHDDVLRVTARVSGPSITVRIVDADRAEKTASDFECAADSIGVAGARRAVHWVGSRVAAACREVSKHVKSRGWKPWVLGWPPHRGCDIILIPCGKKRLDPGCGCMLHGSSGLCRLPGDKVTAQGMRAFGCYKCCLPVGRSSSEWLALGGWDTILDGVLGSLTTEDRALPDSFDSLGPSAPAYDLSRTGNKWGQKIVLAGHCIRQPQ